MAESVMRQVCEELEQGTRHMESMAAIIRGMAVFNQQISAQSVALGELINPLLTLVRGARSCRPGAR